MDGTVDADPRLLAAGTVGVGPNDGSTALALVGLRSFEDEAIRLLGAVGQAGHAAKAEEEVALARARGSAAARDAVSGVSIDDEMARLSRFRHAAEAATSFVRTIDELLQHLIERL
jgi:flagellar hook-associated protein 1 FlgK